MANIALGLIKGSANASRIQLDNELIYVSLATTSLFNSVFRYDDVITYNELSTHERKDHVQRLIYHETGKYPCQYSLTRTEQRIEFENHDKLNKKASHEALETLFKTGSVDGAGIAFRYAIGNGLTKLLS